MRAPGPPLRLLAGPRRVLGAALLLPIALLVGACESTDAGYLSAGGYYDAGLSDPWYHGGGYWDDDDISGPPDGRPRPPPRPEHPIARPPQGPRPAPRPMPSIPSRPRPSMRR